MPEHIRNDGTDTRTAILDVAERLVQSRGFNGFSYADVAAELGITKPALHYHFPGKAELGESLIARYSARFGDALASIDTQAVPAPTKLAAYCDIYRRVLLDGRMCLCGMLAAEFHTFAAPMRLAVARSFEQNEAWLAALLEGGRTGGSLAFEGSALESAQMIIAALEGAMLVARPRGIGTGVFDAVAKRLQRDFIPSQERVPTATGQAAAAAPARTGHR